MRKLLIVVVVLAFSGLPVLGQSKPSIQGVWRVVEVTITNPAPARGWQKGTHTDVQPGMLFFAGRHYSIITDVGTKPRPTTPVKVQGKPTLEETLERWGPFVANAGTYELSGTTLTMRAMVAKNPAIQGEKDGVRFTIKLDGNNLWLTQLENASGKIANPTTAKYERLE